MATKPPNDRKQNSVRAHARPLWRNTASGRRSGPGAAGSPCASRANNVKAAPTTASSPAATRNGAVRPQASAIRGAVRPASTVPPMPIP